MTPINTFDNLMAAIALVQGGAQRNVIGLQSTEFFVRTTFVVDECLSGCTGSPMGMVFKGAHPLLDPPVLTAAPELGTNPMFEVKSGNVEFSGLVIRNAAEGIWLQDGEYSENNSIHNVHFIIDASGIISSRLIWVKSKQARIEKNFFDNITADVFSKAVSVDSADNAIVSMNVFVGPFLDTISVQSGGGVSLIDHNTVVQDEYSGGNGNPIAYSIADTNQFCFRNNVAHNLGAPSGAFGLFVSGSMSAPADGCGGVAVASNAFEGYAQICSGPGCSVFCTGTPGVGMMCDLAPPTRLRFDDDVPCLDPSSGLIDQGINVNVDMDDGSPLLYQGAKPDVGAREVGTLRSFADVQSWCPD
jgi:hypothetical protein